jgi:hypothetical protein
MVNAAKISAGELQVGMVVYHDRQFRKILSIDGVLDQPRWVKFEGCDACWLVDEDVSVVGGHE